MSLKTSLIITVGLITLVSTPAFSQQKQWEIFSRGEKQKAYDTAGGFTTEVHKNVSSFFGSMFGSKKAEASQTDAPAVTQATATTKHSSNTTKTRHQ